MLLYPKKKLPHDLNLFPTFHIVVRISVSVPRYALGMIDKAANLAGKKRYHLSRGACSGYGHGIVSILWRCVGQGLPNMKNVAILKTKKGGKCC